MTVKELLDALPYLEKDEFQVVIATGNDRYGNGHKVDAVLEDKANKTIILVSEEIEKPNITRGATDNE